MMSRLLVLILILTGCTQLPPVIVPEDYDVTKFVHDECEKQGGDQAQCVQTLTGPITRCAQKYSLGSMDFFSKCADKILN